MVKGSVCENVYIPARCRRKIFEKRTLQQIGQPQTSCASGVWTLSCPTSNIKIFISSTLNFLFLSIPDLGHRVDVRSLTRRHQISTKTRRSSLSPLSFHRTTSPTRKSGLRNASHHTPAKVQSSRPCNALLVIVGVWTMKAWRL